MKLFTHIPALSFIELVGSMSHWILLAIGMEKIHVSDKEN
jgi:hypothetical protein